MKDAIKTFALAFMFVVLIICAVMMTSEHRIVKNLKEEVAASSASLSATSALLVQAQTQASANSSAQGVLTDALDRLAVINRDRTIKVEAAIRSNPDWASQPVPVDVIDSLRPSAQASAASGEHP